MFFSPKPDKFINLYVIGVKYERITKKISLRFHWNGICYK